MSTLRAMVLLAVAFQCGFPASTNAPGMSPRENLQRVGPLSAIPILVILRGGGGGGKPRRDRSAQRSRQRKRAEAATLEEEEEEGVAASSGGSEKPEGSEHKHGEKRRLRQAEAKLKMQQERVDMAKLMAPDEEVDDGADPSEMFPEESEVSGREAANWVRAMKDTKASGWSAIEAGVGSSRDLLGIPAKRKFHKFGRVPDGTAIPQPLLCRGI